MRYVLRHGTRKNLYFRSVKSSCIGLDFTFGNEKQAERFASRGAAVSVAKILYAYGVFRIIEVE